MQKVKTNTKCDDCGATVEKACHIGDLGLNNNGVNICLDCLEVAVYMMNNDVIYFRRTPPKD